MNIAHNRAGARVVLALVAVALTLATMAVAQHQQAQALPKDDVRPVSVAVGETFLISLSANPSTGYGWEIDFDPVGLRLIDRQHVPGASGMVGSTGMDEFRLRGLAKGEYELRFSYQRAWEGRVQQSVVYRITVY